LKISALWLEYCMFKAREKTEKKEEENGPMNTFKSV
jgi:hypothetical protein